MTLYDRVLQATYTVAAYAALPLALIGLIGLLVT